MISPAEIGAYQVRERLEVLCIILMLHKNIMYSMDISTCVASLCYSRSTHSAGGSNTLAAVHGSGFLVLYAYGYAPLLKSLDHLRDDLLQKELTQLVVHC
jgi:hypothetical protein